MPMRTALQIVAPSEEFNQRTSRLAGLFMAELDHLGFCFLDRMAVSSCVDHSVHPSFQSRLQRGGGLALSGFDRLRILGGSVRIHVRDFGSEIDVVGAEAV